MKKNTGLKVLTAAVVGVSALILMNKGHHGVETSKQPIDPNNFNEAIASQFNDNLRDVAARLQETEKKLDGLEAKNKALVVQNKALSQAPLNIPSSTNTSMLEKEIADLKEAVTQLKEPPQSPDANTYAIHGKSSGSIPTSNIQDIDALLMKPVNQEEMAYWEKLQAKAPLKDKENPTNTALKSLDEETKPYYTIPAGSDLGHTILLSALIGEVPVEGKLMQPLFPFSALVSRGDLIAANGIPLPPEIAGMKVNGYAIGVGSFLDNISCVRAYVTSALFVFKDGHFVTIGKEQMSSSTEMMNNESLGYLTTPFGNPCIKGAYFTNAPRVLAAMMAAGGVQGMGTALSEWQTNVTAGPNGTTLTPTGSLGTYALGSALSQGSVKVADWLEKRIQGSFDMVFVPASIPLSGQTHRYQPNRVSLHITQTINLDKTQHGRVLDYGRTQHTIHDFSLR